MLNKLLRHFQNKRIEKKQDEIMQLLISRYGSEDKIPAWRLEQHLGITPERIESPASYLESNFDGNLRDIPFLEVLLSAYECAEYSFSQGELQNHLDNMTTLVQIKNSTSIPDSLFEGVFIALTQENKPYISIGTSTTDFQQFIRGLDELDFYKWWRFINQQYEGMTKQEWIVLKGQPEAKTETTSRNKRREEYFYDGYKNRLGNQYYKLKVVIIEDKIASWTTSASKS